MPPTEAIPPVVVTPVDPAVPPTVVMPADEVVPPVGPTGTDPNVAIPPTPPPPWYKDNPGAVAVIVIGLVGIGLLIAWLLWWGDDDDDNALIIDSSTTTEVIDDIVLGTVDTEPVDTTVPESTTVATITTTPPVSAGEPVSTTAPAPATTTATTTATTVAPTTTAASATTTTTPNVTSPSNPDATVMDVLNGTPDLSRLRDAVVQAGLDEQLATLEAVTLFAPSNPAIEAFAATPEGAAILADPAQLEQLLLRHVALEALDGNAVLASDQIETATGEMLPVDGAAQTVAGGKLLVTDVAAANGFVHVVDRVLAG